MYFIQHRTGTIRLLHRNDGSYVLQEEWYDDWKHKRWWQDMPTMEEKDLEDEKLENEFEFIKSLASRTSNKDIFNDINEAIQIIKEDCDKDFKMNNNSVLDFFDFYHYHIDEYQIINFSLWINDDGNIYLQRTFDDFYIYIEFKGDNKIMYNIKCENDDKVKEVAIKDFWKDFNDKEILKKVLDIKKDNE